jgi:NAD(P)-dependent dehydrogenase (short-subunit alcohol dehydrogenase family)
MVEQICLVTGATSGIGRATAHELAQSTVYAATSPDLEGASGRFFINSRQARSSKASYDEALAERLWTVSERLVGLS